MNKNYIIILSLVIVFSSTSCSKYEDGPAFSLRTKKDRLVGVWELDEYNNENIDNEYVIEWEFEKDGDFSQTQTYSYNGSGYSYSYSGDWEFENNKEDIEITLFNDSEDFEILRLTNDELWLEDSNGNEWEFEKLSD